MEHEQRRRDANPGSFGFGIGGPAEAADLDADVSADFAADFSADYDADFSADYDADFSADYDADLSADFSTGRAPGATPLPGSDPLAGIEGRSLPVEGWPIPPGGRDRD